MVLYVKLQNGLGDWLYGVVKESMAYILNRLLEKFRAFETGTDFVMRGTVNDAGGSPQGVLVIIAVDRDLRRWQELGRAASNAKGRFKIPYRYETLREAEGIIQKEVDLVLQVARRLANNALELFHMQEEPKLVSPAESVDALLPVLSESRADE